MQKEAWFVYKTFICLQIIIQVATMVQNIYSPVKTSLIFWTFWRWVSSSEIQDPPLKSINKEKYVLLCGNWSTSDIYKRDVVVLVLGAI